MTKIAILGATSQIAQGLIYYMSKFSKCALYLFARNLDKLKSDCKLYDNISTVSDFEQFNNHPYDAIINCVGFGEPGSLQKNIKEIFFVTEKFDNMAIGYIRKMPKTVYINLSSGAVYGTNFSEPVQDTTKTILDLNKYTSEYNYLVAKLNSEIKHRSFDDLKIIDLRVFSYFSRFINTNGKFLLSECIASIIDKKELKTGSNNIIRDYIHPEDFTRLVMSCIDKKLNMPIDVISKKFASKFEILDMLSSEFGLKYKVEETNEVFGKTASGTKNNYYSILNSYEIFDFKPDYTTMETIYLETKEILNME